MNQRTIGAFCIAVTALLPACTTAEDAVPPNPSSTAPNFVTLASADFAFQAPDSIIAGWTTFRFVNRDDELHYAHAVRLDSGKTMPAFVEAYATAIDEGAPRPTWVTRFGGPGAAAPGDSASVTQIVEPGRYVWICPIEDRSGIPHFSYGEVRTFVVQALRPGAVVQPAPEPTAVIRLVDYAFALDTPLSAGRHTIRVENAGAEPHDVALLKLGQGKTIADMNAWMQDGQGPAPMSAAGGVAAIAPGMEAFFEADLAPGEYVLICFVTAPDGRTHVEHGMVRQFSVG